MDTVGDRQTTQNDTQTLHKPDVLQRMGVPIHTLSSSQIQQWNRIVEQEPSPLDFDDKDALTTAMVQHFRRVQEFRKSVLGRSPISPRTEAQHRAVVRQLENRHGSLEAALEWLPTAKLRPQTFRKYKDAIRFIAREAQDFALEERLKTLQQTPKNQKKWNESQRVRAKNLTGEELQAIGEWLKTKGMTRAKATQEANRKSENESGVVWITRTLAYLVATRACGLRPIEWETAHLQYPEDHPSENRADPDTPLPEYPTLIVQTAKIKFDAPKQIREIPLDDLSHEEERAIQIHLREIQKHLQEGKPFASYLERIRSWLRRARSAIFPDRKKSVDLYSLRHAYHVRLVERGLPKEEIAYRMGHKVSMHRIYGGGHRKTSKPQESSRPTRGPLGGASNPGL